LQEPQSTRYHRNLPHINPHGGTCFVTYCLHETISQPEIKQLIQKHQTHLEELRKQSQTTPEQIDIENRKYFKKLDEQIHQAKGAHYLKNEKVAQIVANSLHFWDGKKIDLMAFCIMSNHVHLVLRLLESENQEIFLSEVLESIKKFSARECNLAIGRTGQLWQKESFDRLVRDRKELYRIICYILDNPTKEGLCENRADWKWNYVKEEYNEFM
jgi:putative transposase